MDWSLGKVTKGTKGFELLFQARPEQITMDAEEENNSNFPQEEKRSKKKSKIHN